MNCSKRQSQLYLNKLTYVKIYKIIVSLTTCYKVGTTHPQVLVWLPTLTSNSSYPSTSSFYWTLRKTEKLQFFALSTPIRTSEATTALNHLVSGRKVTFSNTCNNTQLQFTPTKGVAVGITFEFRAHNARS